VSNDLDTNISNNLDLFSHPQTHEYNYPILQQLGIFDSRSYETYLFQQRNCTNASSHNSRKQSLNNQIQSNSLHSHNQKQVLLSSSFYS
jgi:hypothetical protein